MGLRVSLEDQARDAPRRGRSFIKYGLVKPVLYDYLKKRLCQGGAGKASCPGGTLKLVQEGLFQRYREARHSGPRTCRVPRGARNRSTYRALKADAQLAAPHSQSADCTADPISNLSGICSLANPWGDLRDHCPSEYDRPTHTRLLSQKRQRRPFLDTIFHGIDGT
jgi:hypothetical protein